MTERIAIGSSDGQWIDQHFVNCLQFFVYDVSDDGQWTLLEVRKNEGPGIMDGHNEKQLQKTVTLLSDCQKVLVGRIGPGANQALKDLGISSSTTFISIKHAQEKLYK